MEKSISENLAPFHSSAVSLCFLTALVSTVTGSQLPAQSQVLPELCALLHSHLPVLFPAHSHRGAP